MDRLKKLAREEQDKKNSEIDNDSQIHNENDSSNSKFLYIGNISIILYLGLVYFIFRLSTSYSIVTKPINKGYESPSGSSSSYSSSTTKYVGSHSGRWEGLLFGEHNSGTASFNVESDGSSVLRMSSVYGDVAHRGYIRNDHFIITSGTGGNKSCGIVQLSNGFKIVLIWTGMNSDVYFN